MMVIFLDKEGRCIKTWTGEELSDNVLPLPNDHVMLRWGGSDEEEQEFVVLYRTFRNLTHVYVTVDLISD